LDDDTNDKLNNKNNSNTNFNLTTEKEITITKESQEIQEIQEIQEKNNKKMSKREKKELKSKVNKEKKSQYKFDINTNAKKILNTSNTSNSLTTLYSDDLEVIVGGKTLISTSNITINSGQKYFVIGQNGIGKTSLLKQIYLNLKDKLDILMLDQDIELESTTQTIQEFILGADKTLFESKKRMDQLEMLDEMDNIESAEYENLSEIIVSREWDKYESESKRIINGLGFNNPEQSVSILSGGKRMILAIGKALLRKPEILILDEPTNHLDLDVVIWLTNYLEGYKKTLIVITHQIGLVNSLADVIWYIGNPELTGNKMYTIRGHYDKLIKFLENKEKETNKNYDKFNKKVEEMRKKSTPKKDVDEYIKKNGVPRPPKPYNVNITFDNVIELSTRNIIEFKEVNFKYPNSEPIYQDLNITLGMGSRIVLVGPNGCGKTTFFKLASGEISPTDGYILSDERLRVGYYNQQIIDHLPLELNSIEYLQSLNSKLDNGKCRSILGKLGIKKYDNLDLPTNKIGNLSGGQKARVSFGGVQMSNPHLILLDEPTNHLDLESIEGLIKGINEFNGGIVIITHDMYLIESIENADIYQVSSSNIVKFMGDFEEYCEKVTNQ
jgi:ATP-binding cassette subfamily F protein 1